MFKCVHPDFLAPRYQDFSRYNCYAYALGRHDLGWVNPGWIAKVIGQNERVTLSDLFSVFADKKTKETSLKEYRELFQKDGNVFLGETVSNTGSVVFVHKTMFVAVKWIVNDSFTYHCYTYDAEAGWHSKDGNQAPVYHHVHDQESLLKTAKKDGYSIPLGFFKPAEITTPITEVHRRAFKKLYDETSREIYHQMYNSGMLLGR